MNHDTTISDTVANTATIGGVLAFIMKFTPYITALVLTTALVLNILRIYDWIKSKKENKNAYTSKKIRK
jgi:hypothetical protein